MRNVAAKEFDHTVTCLSGSNLTHWPIISRAMVEHIDSRNFSVICPDKIANIVQDLSDPAFSVLRESTFNLDLLDTLRKRVEAADNLQRFGWYLQQFLKIDFIEKNRCSEHILIWDSDTLPIREIRFRDTDGRTIFYSGEEYHQEYFHSIYRLTGLRKAVSESFIAQCFPVEVALIVPYFDEWKRKGAFWYETIFDSIDFAQPSGFSEYELLGTITAHETEDTIRFSERKWIRNGSVLFGKPSNIRSQKTTNIAFVAFEHGEKTGWLARLKRSTKIWVVTIGKRLFFDRLVPKRMNRSPFIKGDN